MKKYIPLPLDFAALNAEVLNKIKPTVDSETTLNTVSGINFVVLTQAADYIQELAPILASESFDIEAVGRYRIVNEMSNPYTLTMADIIIIPFQNADSCTISIYEPDANATPFNYRFPVGIYPNHGFYYPDDCALIETFDLVEPIFINRNTAWQIKNSDNANVAHFLVLFSKSDNSSYFA